MVDNKYIIHQDQTLLDALKQINVIWTGPLVLFVVDNKECMVGTLTDGDARRALTSGASVQDKVGVIMPCIILGIIPAIIALAIGNLLLLIWGIFFITVAAGDIWMVWLLGKEKSDNMIIDHPTEAGFYVIEEQD